jgi:hypothetical protein
VKNVQPAQSFNSAMLWAKLGPYLDSSQVDGQASNHDAASLAKTQKSTQGDGILILHGKYMKT